MLKLCVNRAGPFMEKANQNFDQPNGNIITWGYDLKRISPKVLKEIVDNRITEKTNVLLCSMVLGETKKHVVAFRTAEILRIKNHTGYIRIDLRLIGHVEIEDFPKEGQENYLMF
jgi:hypothetical protein